MIELLTGNMDGAAALLHSRERVPFSSVIYHVMVPGMVVIHQQFFQNYQLSDNFEKNQIYLIELIFFENNLPQV